MALVPSHGLHTPTCFFANCSKRSLAAVKLCCNLWVVSKLPSARNGFPQTAMKINNSAAAISRHQLIQQRGCQSSVHVLATSGTWPSYSPVLSITCEVAALRPLNMSGQRSLESQGWLRTSKILRLQQVQIGHLLQTIIKQKPLSPFETILKPCLQKSDE